MYSCKGKAMTEHGQAMVKPWLNYAGQLEAIRDPSGIPHPAHPAFLPIRTPSGLDPDLAHPAFLTHPAIRHSGPSGIPAHPGSQRSFRICSQDQHAQAQIRMGPRWAKSGWSPDGQEYRMGRMGYAGWVPDGFQLPSQHV